MGQSVIPSDPRDFMKRPATAGPSPTRSSPPTRVAASATAIVVHANEHDPAVTVGETHHRVHQLIVSQRAVGFGKEFGCELLSAREELAEFFVGDHAMNLSRVHPPDDSRRRETDD